MNYLNINQEKIKPVVDELNVLLADYHIYYQNLRTFHWNILGKNFFDLHQKFEHLYNEARVKIDELAERILTLRYHPLSKGSQYLEMTSIKEADTVVDDTQMVKTILGNHKVLLMQMSMILKVANDAGDEGTIDLIGAYIRELEKESWMLNAWTQKADEELHISYMPEKK
ncbi:DNA starvation/stationary phase protection protein [uncultured Dokdonia sp.]|uniref:Dps family protein n=1 Tax=uncultured Dokdonia sp. TaxID=575653 RepID=UPI00260A0820|nr:DNA starvation/stationary phase protection protein [uncultured Dokdonia sp.]